MWRSRDRLIPLVAGLVVIAVAVSVVLLLNNASDRGVSALTRAKVEQVQTTADSFNTRVASQLTSSSALGTAPWQLTRNSASDQKVLNSYNLDKTASAGFFLVDAAGLVTSGVLLRTGTLGTHFAPAGGWPAMRQQLAHQSAVVLPVDGESLTTDLPTYDFIFAIRGAGPTSVRGAFVYEQAVSSRSPFEQEIAQLGDRAASSAAWFFIDSHGTVVATTRDAGLAAPVENPRYRTLAAGASHLDGRIVVVADVPSINWRVVFRENTSQFEGPLSGPLQRAGLILVLLLLLTGLLLVVILVRRLRGVREQQRRLAELTRSQAEFISVVSQELRTPVSGILGFLQTTVDHWSTLTDADKLSTVRRAASNARRLQAMTRDVLDTESIDGGRFTYSFHRVELGAELQTAADASNDADPSRPVLLSPPGRPIVIDADPERLQQLLGNLLENARRNAPPAEPVVIETRLVEDEAAPGRARVQVSVIDTGPGVNPEALERIFERFVRGRTNSVTGTGLGLYIARTIVEAHHGRIWCVSDPGPRTIFAFELPLASTQDAREQDVPVPAGV